MQQKHQDCLLQQSFFDASGLMQALLQSQEGALLREQHKRAAVWLVTLLHRAPNTAAEAEVAERLTFLPDICLDWAQQMVSAGVCISYAQLLAAANSMVAGVEVWVQARKKLKMKSDIPQAAHTICCSSKWVSAGAALVSTAAGVAYFKHVAAAIVAVSRVA
jgi:hypothetical protein